MDIQLLLSDKTLAVSFMCIGAVILCVVAVKVMQKIGLEKVRKTVYRGFVQAEHYFKHGENTQKFEYVVGLAKNAIPAPFNMFITEKLLRNIIQLWFDLCKDLLNDGRLNGQK